MRPPLPPPPPPPSGGTAKPDEAALLPAASESPEFPKMIAFVNELRSKIGLGEIASLPEANGNEAKNTPLSQAMTISVIKHQDGGPFYALVYKEKTAEALTNMGLSSTTIQRLAWSEPDVKMWEFRLPMFLKEFA